MRSPLASNPAVAPRSHASLRLRLEGDSADIVCFGHPRVRRTLSSVASNSGQTSQAVGAYLPTHGALPIAGSEMAVPKLRRDEVDA